MRGATIALQQQKPSGGSTPTRLNLVGAAFAAKYVGQTKARRRHKSSARVPAMAEMGETLVAAEAAHLSWTRRWCMRLFCRPRLRGETRRQWANMVLESSRLATYIDALQIVLSLLLVGFAVYLSWDGPEPTEEPVWISTTELVFTILFTVDYFAHLFAAEDRWAFCISFFAVIDVVTILPVYLQWYVKENTAEGLDPNSVSRLQAQFLRPIRVLRALRILRAYRILSFTKSAVQRQLFMVLLTVVSVIVCTTGMIQALEYNDDPRTPNGQSLPFLEAMYFIVVTITTVGFGDVAPKSELGRVTIMGMITASMIIIPTQVSKLSALLALRSVYDGEYKTRGHSHVLVCGDPPAHTLVFFLHEFFNASSKMTSERVVIMGTDEPSYELKRLLQRPALESRVTYYRGNAMLDSDLFRAKVHQAKAAFVMLSTRQDDHEQVDTGASLVTSSIRAFTSRRERKNGIVRCPVFTQVMASANVRHAQLAGASQVIGTQRLKYSVLALSAKIPGFSTFVSNLLTTLVRHDLSQEPEWLQEYADGAQNEIYAATFPIGMHGLKFFTAVEMIKQELGAVLIGVETQSEASSLNVTPPNPRKPRPNVIASALASVRPRPALPQGFADRTIRLAPVDYYVDGTGSDRAIVLCSSPTLAERISKLSVNKVKGYKIIQNYFRDSFKASNRRRNLSTAIQTKDNEHWGWKAIKNRLQNDGVSLIDRIANGVSGRTNMTARPDSRQRRTRASAYSSSSNGSTAALQSGVLVTKRGRRVEALHGASTNRGHLLTKVRNIAADESFSGEHRTVSKTATLGGGRQSPKVRARPANNAIALTPIPGDRPVGAGADSLATEHLVHSLTGQSTQDLIASPSSAGASSPGAAASPGDAVAAAVESAAVSSPPDGAGAGSEVWLVDGADAGAGGDAATGAPTGTPAQPGVATVGPSPKPVRTIHDTRPPLHRTITPLPQSTRASDAPTLKTPATGGAGAAKRVAGAAGGTAIPAFSLGTATNRIPHTGDSGTPLSADTPAPLYHRPMFAAPRARRVSFGVAGSRADPLPNANLGRESMTAAYTGFLMNPPSDSVCNHTIVCGLPDDLDDFVTPFRSRDAPGTVSAIVILSLRRPTMRSFSKIMGKPNIHFAFGSPRDPAALREAGVYRAHTVVVLCNPSRAEGDGLLPEDDLMIDADAMTTLRYIVELTESRAVPPKVVVELIRGSNIKFVNYQRSHYHADSAAYIDVDESDEDEDDFGALRHGTGELDLVLRPAFASGQVCTSHLIEGLLGAAFHKPYVLKTTELLLTADTSGLEHVNTTDSPAAAVSSSDVLQEDSKAMFQATDDDVDPGPESCLHVVNLPSFAHGQTFIQLFVKMLRKHSKVVVAVYRSGSAAAAPAPYLVTNPQPDMVMQTQDKLILLGQMLGDIENDAASP